jgi:hypothetical protein
MGGELSRIDTADRSVLRLASQVRPSDTIHFSPSLTRVFRPEDGLITLFADGKGQVVALPELDPAAGSEHCRLGHASWLDDDRIVFSCGDLRFGAGGQDGIFLLDTKNEETRRIFPAAAEG